MPLYPPQHLWRKQRRRRLAVFVVALLCIVAYAGFVWSSVEVGVEESTQAGTWIPEAVSNSPQRQTITISTASQKVIHHNVHKDHASICGASLPSVFEVLGYEPETMGTHFHSNITSDWVESAPSSCSLSVPQLRPTSPLGSRRALSAATQRRFNLCYRRQNRFLFFGNNWGRHSNQLTSLAAALIIGRSLNRTVIVPPFFPDHSGKKQNSATGSLEIIDLYNISLLLDVHHSPFCVLSEQEFIELERERKNDQNIGPMSSAVNAVPALCITMRGIKTFPRQPKGYRFECKREVFVKYKKDLSLFLKTATSTSDLDAEAPMPSHYYTPQHARVLTVPLMIYYATKVPLPSVLCVWKLLQPHPVVSDVLNVFRHEYNIDRDDVSYGNNNFKSQLSVVGVHVRSLEGSCDSRVDELERHAQKQAKEMGLDGSVSKSIRLNVEENELRIQRRAALKAQCQMDVSYVLSVRKGAFAIGMPEIDAHSATDGTHFRKIVFVADDNQNPDRVAKLVTALSSNGDPQTSVQAFRLRDVFSTTKDPTSPLALLLKTILSNQWVEHNTSFEVLMRVKHEALRSTILSQRLIAATNDECDIYRNENAKERSIIRNRFYVFSELLFMQLDFWSLVEADILVGNQLSTLSQNVCRRRLSRGLACDNFVGAEGLTLTNQRP